MPTEAHWHSPERARSVCLASLQPSQKDWQRLTRRRRRRPKPLRGNSQPFLEQEARLREALPLYDSWEAVRRRLAQTEQAFRKTAETRKKTEEEKENSAAALAHPESRAGGKEPRAASSPEKQRKAETHRGKAGSDQKPESASGEPERETDRAFRGTASAAAGDQPLRRDFQRI